MKPIKEKYPEITGKIKELFQNGFSPDSRVLHYIDSTFSNPSAAEIEKILTGESDYEKEALLKLIFFPDESTRIFLEEFFQKENIRKEDEKEIAVYFSAKMITTKIRFPDGRGEIAINVPQSILSEYIYNLKMTKKLHIRLAEALENISCAATRSYAKVKLRNARGEFAGKRLDFLCLFFEKMGPENESIFRECLDSAIEVLEDADDESNIYEVLLSKKAASFQGLVNSERFEEQLRKNNIETLLLQGARPVSIDKVAAQRKMEIMDRICLAVFGKTEYYEKNLKSLSF